MVEVCGEVVEGIDEAYCTEFKIQLELIVRVRRKGGEKKS